jgi:hypothetical protein
MQKNDISSIVVKSDPNYPKVRRPFLTYQNKNLSSKFVNNSNDSVISNTNNDILDPDDDDEENDVDEENIFEKTLGNKLLHTPINDTHRLFLAKNRFGRTFINSIPLKRILIPKSKSPSIKNYGKIRNRNDFKNSYAFLKKNLTTRNEIIELNNDFLHCRNCMMIIALNRYGKYYFNK